MTETEQYECFYDDNAARYRLCYMDDDETPELVVIDPGYWISAYSYMDGELVTIAHMCPLGADGKADEEFYSSDMAREKLQEPEETMSALEVLDEMYGLLDK